MTRHPSLPPEPLPLTEASVQEIQLELIRRHSFNAFDAPRIVASLREHRKLWRAVIMDRPGVCGDRGMGLSSLIKLRDLPTNDWNVDQLFILCDNASDAHQLARIAEEEEWLADEIRVRDDAHDVGGAIGEYPCDGKAIVEMWWD